MTCTVNLIKNVFEGIERAKERIRSINAKVDSGRERKCLVLDGTPESLLHLPRAAKWTIQCTSILELQHKYDLQ